MKLLKHDRSDSNARIASVGFVQAIIRIASEKLFSRIIQFIGSISIKMDRKGTAQVMIKNIGEISNT